MQKGTKVDGGAQATGVQQGERDCLSSLHTFRILRGHREFCIGGQFSWSFLDVLERFFSLISHNLV